MIGYDCNFSQHTIQCDRRALKKIIWNAIL